MKHTPEAVESSALAGLRNANFVEVSDCVLLQVNEMSLPTPNEVHKFLNEAKMDRTAYEAFQNHVHLDDIVTFEDSMQVIRAGLVLVESWSHKLKIRFPKYTFHIVLAFSEADVGIAMFGFTNCGLMRFRGLTLQTLRDLSWRVSW